MLSKQINWVKSKILSKKNHFDPNNLFWLNFCWPNLFTDSVPYTAEFSVYQILLRSFEQFKNESKTKSPKFTRSRTIMLWLVKSAHMWWSDWTRILSNTCHRAKVENVRVINPWNKPQTRKGQGLCRAIKQSKSWQTNHRRCWVAENKGQAC